MPMPAAPEGSNPLQRFAALLSAGRPGQEPQPIPLTSTAIDVRIAGGLAIVRTRRVFANAEAESIEATLTFPVPVHATVFGMSVSIGSRTFTAVTQASDTARLTYEAAVAEGRAAVIHHEPLKGVHRIEVAHIAPGTEVVVTSDWALPLAPQGGDTWHLRLPMTVGEIFGRSPLTPDEDIEATGPEQWASLQVVCDTGRASLNGQALGVESITVSMSRPIDLVIRDHAAGSLTGRAADGRAVTLTVRQAFGTDMPVHAAVLVDRSGSMGSQVRANALLTKHGALCAGLRSWGGALGARDTIELWEFDHTVRTVGSTARGEALSALIARLSPPGGGTEIGQALSSVIEASRARDILLITDGQSHALDVQALARAGRRITVVLIGEDSLEARVGQLAAMTGGEIFVAGDDIAATLGLALAALRRPAARLVPLTAPVVEVARLVGGAELAATWWTDGTIPIDAHVSRAVAAFSAALAMPALTEPEARALALAEGLVSHLTSLVFVDADGPMQEGQPNQRKVSLPAPAVHFSQDQSYTGHAASLASMAPVARSSVLPPVADRARPPAASRARPPVAIPKKPPVARSFFDRVRSAQTPVDLHKPIPDTLISIVAALDWDKHCDQFLFGDTENLPLLLRLQLTALSESPAVVDAAGALGLSPAQAVLAGLASLVPDNHAAQRLLRLTLPDPDPALMSALVTALSNPVQAAPAAPPDSARDPGPSSGGWWRLPSWWRGRTLH